MIHPKQHIVDLVEILTQHGISNVIISPGSRNAPLIEAFYKKLGTKCLSIVDERSAAYVGLGVARNTGLPAVLLCTSGTAVLNYSPALAEAFYQQVPLIAVTADRPEEWINQLDNQTISQKNVYSNFVKSSYNLPQTITNADDLWVVHRLVNEAYNVSLRQPFGPVHINVPLPEPLYEPLPLSDNQVRIIKNPQNKIKLELAPELVNEWKSAKRIMIIHGQDQPHSKVTEHLQNLADDKRVCVIAENISNLIFSKIIDCPDLILANSKISTNLLPDLILISGLQVVSKRLKSFLRKAKKLKCWRIGYENNIPDTYQQVDTTLNNSAIDVYQALNNYITNSAEPDYQDKWLALKEQNRISRDRLIKDLPFSDLIVMNGVIQAIPEGSFIELGNSSVIRYSQLFDTRNDLTYYSNRGVSGIDGCLSAAVGTAMSTTRLVTAIVGDLSFVYDSNALWNRNLPENLRIIVINNRGGGIFHMIDGPCSNGAFDQYVNAYHPVNIENLAKAFGLEYLNASDNNQLNESLKELYRFDSKTSLLEVFTSSEVSAVNYRKILGINQ